MPRTTAPPVFRSILCPVDVSANSRAALRYATMLARLSGAQLFVLYVTDPLLAMAAAAARPDVQHARASADGELRRFVTAVTARETPPVATTVLTVAGKPAHEIVRAAERHDCDLIVIGYRGVGRASRMLFGSTTEGVMRMAAVPVLAIPPARRRARLPIERSRLKRVS